MRTGVRSCRRGSVKAAPPMSQRPRSGQGVHMMKLFLATTALVALIAVPAGAADMRVKAAPVLKPACANFGGWYFGGHVGWNYYKHEMRDLDNYGFGVFGMDHVESVLNSENSWHGGVQGGYNWQSGCA